MDYRRLGRSGLQVSEFSLGSWVTFGKQVKQDDALSIMSHAYDSGINFFDNAEGYEAGQSEVLMGEALTKLGWGRDTYSVSSKVFFGGSKPTQRGLSRKHVTDAAHAALGRLQVDYLDLYFAHRPDPETPIDETVWAMHNLVTQGKILYWGTSEWSAEQITEAVAFARENHLTPPTMEQPEYNLFHRAKVETEFAPLYESAGLGTTIWSPLASGLLTGKYNNGIPDGSRMTLPGYEWLRQGYESPEGQDKLAKTRKLGTLADEAGLPLTHLALLWCLANPNVSTVILGASKKTQLQDNLAALDSKAKITPDILTRIDEILQETSTH
ncbi:potassium channel beta subunit family protein [Streptomyces mirabilis]|uniref:potassium channel beta subunit family protein n=1 Tax=Streptomyces mirabilis TaxID=68239 RepID=UPI0036DB0514